jgi:hypothetical protein
VSRWLLGVTPGLLQVHGQCLSCLIMCLSRYIISCASESGAHTATLKDKSESCALACSFTAPGAQISQQNGNRIETCEVPRLKLGLKAFHTLKEQDVQVETLMRCNTNSQDWYPTRPPVSAEIRLTDSHTLLAMDTSQRLVVGAVLSRKLEVAT